MADKRLVEQIEAILKSEITLNTIARHIERAMNAEIPGTPRLTGRQVGGRVMYVALPGRGKAMTDVSKRAGQVLAFLARNRKASSMALQKALRVNRNVIAGAIHELKQAGLVSVEALAGPPVLRESAAEYQPRTRTRRSNGGKRVNNKRVNKR